MARSEIAALKEALDARNDLELAAKLGINRSTIAHWKQRGAVPAKYHYLLSARGEAAIERSLDQQLFAEPEYHYWLRAALALAGAIDRAATNDASAASYERLIVNLMALALKATRTDLGLSKIQDEGTWVRLMEVLRQRHSDDVADLAKRYQL
jgi:hypothetical protein